MCMWESESESERVCVCQSECAIGVERSSRVRVQVAWHHKGDYLVRKPRYLPTRAVCNVRY